MSESNRKYEPRLSEEGRASRWGPQLTLPSSQSGWRSQQEEYVLGTVVKGSWGKYGKIDVQGSLCGN